MTAAQINSCWWAYLVVLLYRLGGVAGATRRIVFNWPGEFTIGQIRRSLELLYPGLRPGEFQVQDVIERMARFRQIVPAGDGVFKVAERRESIAELASVGQLTFSL